MRVSHDSEARTARSPMYKARARADGAPLLGTRRAKLRDGDLVSEMHSTTCGVPDMPATPHRTVRVPDEVWVPAVARAAERGETVSDVVRRALVEYLMPHAPQPQEPTADAEPR